MNKKVTNATELRPNVFHIAEAGYVYCTLVIGDKEALLIDTGMGIYDVKGYIESVTDKPYKVINTHGHPDHILGNGAFPYTYIHKNDVELAKYFSSKEKIRHSFMGDIKMTDEEFEQYASNKDFKLETINIGDVFDLGGKTLEVVPLFGHTQGSIGLLWKEERLLFAGDAVNGWLWLFMDESSTFTEYRKSLESIMQLPFDNFVSGHSTDIIPKDYINAIMKNIDNFKHNEATYESILGYDTYNSEYSDGKYMSKIFYSKKQMK